MGLTFSHNFIMVNMLCKGLKNKGNILGVGLTGSWAMSPIETIWMQIRIIQHSPLTGSWAMSPIETAPDTVNVNVKLTGSWAMSPIETCATCSRRNRKKYYLFLREAEVSCL